MDGSPPWDQMHGGHLDGSADGLPDEASVVLHRLASQAAVLAGGLAVACGGMLLLRRVCDAIVVPPGSGAVFVVCVTGLLLVMVGDLGAASRSRGETPSRARRAPAVLARVGLLMGLAAVCMPPRTPRFVDAFVALGTVAISLAPLVRQPLVDALRTWGPPRRPPVAMPAARFAQPFAQDGRPAVSTSAVPGTLRQRFERLVLPSGGECVRGRLCVPVSKGARAGCGHVGFCPPLASQPTVDVTSDYDAVEAVVSVAEALPWGARIECRLDEPAEEAIEIPVDIVVTTAA